MPRWSNILGSVACVSLFLASGCSPPSNTAQLPPPITKQPAVKGVPPGQPTANEVAVWVLAEGPFATKELEKLAAMGERLFPAFEDILDGKAREGGESAVARVFVVLRMMNGDRTLFLDRAVARLGDKKLATRFAAIEFLGSAGGANEAAPLSLLLLGETSEERYVAAKAIAAIGGKGQIAVFDLIIKNATNYERDGKIILSNFDIDRFEKCRDELKARLKKDKPNASSPEKR